LSDLGYFEKDGEKVAEHRKYLEKGLVYAKALFDSGHLESCARYLRSLSHFAWGNATGYYANWEIESLLNQIGNSISGNKKYAPSAEGNRVLHVATELYDIGGHSRLLLNWCKYDKTRQHTILVTRQPVDQLPEKILTEYDRRCDEIITLQSENVLDASAELRKFAANFDLVVLHIHPDDVIPVIAFSSVNLPPICLVNHADHLFWVGPSICDCLIQIRASNINLDTVRRGVDRQCYVPLLAPKTENDNKCRMDYRKELGVADHEIMLLTTGTKYKYLPFANHNFFESIIPVLNKYPGIILFVAGIGSKDELAIRYAHKQIRFAGTVKDLYKYESACDLYLEGFPFSSFLALLQAARKGRVVQLMYDPYDAIRLFPDGIAGFRYPKDQEEWRTELANLLADSGARLELLAEQQKFLADHYTINAWEKALEKLYFTMRDVTHQVKEPRKNLNYLGRNELFLLNTDLHLKIDHFADLQKLSIRNKIRVIRGFGQRPKTVMFRPLTLARFFLS
jgi:glycosyltransferase involved in cell wall biosynthesis